MKKFLNKNVLAALTVFLLAALTFISNMFYVEPSYIEAPLVVGKILQKTSSPEIVLNELTFSDFLVVDRLNAESFLPEFFDIQKRNIKKQQKAYNLGQFKYFCGGRYLIAENSQSEVKFFDIKKLKWVKLNSINKTHQKGKREFGVIDELGKSFLLVYDKEKGKMNLNVIDVEKDKIVYNRNFDFIFDIYQGFGKIYAITKKDIDEINFLNRAIYVIKTKTGNEKIFNIRKYDNNETTSAGRRAVISIDYKNKEITEYDYIKEKLSKKNIKLPFKYGGFQIVKAIQAPSDIFLVLKNDEKQIILRMKSDNDKYLFGKMGEISPDIDMKNAILCLGAKYEESIITLSKTDIIEIKVKEKKE